MSCIFCRIVQGEVKAEIVARLPGAVAFLDVTPLADGHVLVVPQAHVARIEDMSEADAAALFQAVTALARPVREAVGAAGSTIGVNNGEATGQTVPHVHVHIVPRWPDDGAGSVHSIFRPQPHKALAEVGDAIRARLGGSRAPA